MSAPLPPNFPVLKATQNQYGPISTSTFGPDQNLIGSQFTPGQSPGAQTAQGDVLANLQGLQNAPDQAALEQQQFQALAGQSNPIYQQNLRTVGQDAAKYGRIGSGVTTSQLGDVASNYNQYLGNTAAQLAASGAQQQYQNQLSGLGASQNVLGQLSGLDQQQYGNLVGERGYQQGLSQQAYGNAMGENSLLASLGGFGGSPLDSANYYSQQGQQGMGAGGDILSYLLKNYGQKKPGAVSVDYGPGGDTSTFGQGFGPALPLGTPQ
jgi:hypothetical protein